jgi:thiol:disulfide interchange protein DsbD
MTTGPMPSGRADARIALVALCAWLAAACAVWAQQALPQSEATAVESASSAAGSASNAAGSGSSDGGGVVSRLRQFAGAQADAEPEFLPPEQAFKVRVTVRDAHTLAAEFVPAQGYYLYRDKIRFILPEGAPVSVAEVALPAGERKDDPNFGVTEVYHVPVRARVALARTDSAEQPIALEVRYQGCADQGLCYPPEKKVFNLLLAAAEPGAAPAAPVTDVPADESSLAAGILSAGDFWGVVASFFGFGLLLAFTPCVFPMIPILSGIIVGRGHQVTRRHAFTLSGVYVLGMAVTYALAGVAAGLTGTLLSNALQNPWVLGTFAGLFVVLALAMFGLYELQLPAALQSQLSNVSNRLKGGTFWGVFAMGVLSALIVGPCVAAPLAGALLYINQSRDALLGGSALFAMALGMGAPMIAVGVSAGALLPKAGAWMQTVKSFFGVVLLGLAIWIVSPVIPSVAHMLLWAALLIVSAIYLHAIDPLPHNASGFRKLWKGVGVIALLLGVALLVGALSGTRDILQPLSGLRVASGGASAASAEQPRFILVRSVQELERQLAQAGGRPAMLDFYADWCISCKEMERFTFTDPRVRSRMDRMLLLKADVTASAPEDLALLKRFGLFGPPGTLFFGPGGEQLPHRVIGFQDAERFAASLDAVLRAS